VRKTAQVLIWVLILSALILVSTGCRERVELIYVGADRVIQELPNGNFEVSPELVILYRKYKKFWDEKHKVTEAE